MLPDPTQFLSRLFANLPGQPSDYDHLPIDHLCYRTATAGEYVNLRNALSEQHELLVESTIGGRPIATFRLSGPIVYGDRRIPLVELPAPKPGSPYPTGWEHAEFVTDRPLAAFARYLTDELGVATTDLDRSGLHKARNADLRLRFADGSGVKFHEQALDVVIAGE